MNTIKEILMDIIKNKSCNQLCVTYGTVKGNGEHEIYKCPLAVQHIRSIDRNFRLLSVVTNVSLEMHCTAQTKTIHQAAVNMYIEKYGGSSLFEELL